MQNRYVGDVGDFGKYGLLRALCQPVDSDGPAFRLGVVWYLASDETHNNDGRHIGYLEQTTKNLQTFRACDPSLYDNLADIVKGGDRNISAIRQRQVLPDNTVYYERLLDLGRNTRRSTPDSRIQARQEWVQGAVQVTEDCDVVFLDPDNGIGSAAQASSRTGDKYVLLEELFPYVDRGQTLIIYHHLNRQAPAPEQIRERLGQVRHVLGEVAEVMAIRYRRGSARIFIECVRGIHRHRFESRTQKFLSGFWGQHFERYLLSPQG